MASFEKLSSHYIPVLKATLEQYVGRESGVRHVHLASDEDELAFLVGFATVPQANDGRAHILEHLALCGSERYPVADPFFAMMRRSTATFMNAMTYADRTVYPFASTDKVDFFNLLDVYLDATFFPKLDYLAFRQEGWRHTFKDGMLAFQGVVLNEMKGAFGNPSRALNLGIREELFAGTTYAVESGGDPLKIPELTHDLLKEFHATHYHPSQAMFMTAGRIAASDIQEKIRERVLSRISGRSLPRKPELAGTWDAPRHTDIRVPSQEARPDEFGVQLAWRLGESSDQLASYRAQLLSKGLLGNASAPALKAMESAGFGRPSQMNGADFGARQTVLHLGMEGLTEAQIEPALACIRQALECSSEQGLPSEVFVAAVRDMRYRQREVRGGSMPDALGRMLHALPVLMYGGDVREAFDNEPVLNRLETEIVDPDFFRRLVRDLLDNPTCLFCRVIPDAAFAAKRTQQETERLAALDAKLDDEQRRRILDENDAIAARSKAGGSTDVLPRIAPSDVDAIPRELPAIRHPEEGLVFIDIPSNGITYATVMCDVSALQESDWHWLSLYADILPDLGVGKLNYEQAGAWRQRLVPSFDVYLDALEEAGRESLTPRLCIHAGGLHEDQASLAEVIKAWALEVRFDEVERIDFLVKSRIERKLSSLSEAGNQYASMAATAPFSEQRRFGHVVHGMASLGFVSALKAQLQGAPGAQDIADQLKRLHERIIDCPRRIVWSGAERDMAVARRLLRAMSRAPAHQRPDSMRTSQSLPLANCALMVSSQVNHCFTAWSAPGMAHEDAAPLAVAAELLSHRILHRRLREQGGAYGGGAAYSESDRVFTMSSFRDPRLAETYVDFRAALDELLSQDFSREALDEAIIGVIKRLDKPLSPYSRAMEAFNLQRRGVTAEMRRRFRHQVLGCRLDHVTRAAQRWLKNGTASRAASAGRAEQDLAGLQAVDLLALAS